MVSVVRKSKRACLSNSGLGSIIRSQSDDWYSWDSGSWEKMGAELFVLHVCVHIFLKCSIGAFSCGLSLGYGYLKVLRSVLPKGSVPESKTETSFPSAT